MKFTALAPIIAISLTGSAALAGGYADSPASVVQPVPVAAPDAGNDWTGAYAGVQLEFGNATIVPGPPDPDFDGHFAGIFAGYRADLGNFVIGGELDYVTGELTSTSPGSVDDIMRAGLEFGYDASPALIYATAGWARAGTTDPGGTTDNNGTYYGIGVDYMINDRLVAGLEILHHDFEDIGTPPPADMDMTTVGLSLALRF
jgi:hypothetical protein